MTSITPPRTPLAPTDQRPTLLDEIISGLSGTPATLPCKLLYDKRGSELFDQICELPEYYPTRTETAIAKDNIDAICAALGKNITLIELGSGSSLKIQLLLDHLHKPAGYVPIDISEEHLHDSVRTLTTRYPSLPIHPLPADYCQPFDLPEAVQSAQNRVVYFPGSTIGNFHPHEAAGFLAQLGEIAGPGGKVLLGVDLRKNPSILLPAYNDSAGITAQFNINILHRLRDEFDAELDVDGFEHHARWDDRQSRIEMHLVARTPQTIRIQGHRFDFARSESIWTESSYKHSMVRFATLCEGLELQDIWTDPQELFSVQLWQASA